MTEYAKCYIDYEGKTYVVTFCYGKIKVYLVTKYDIFKNIPVLKNFEKYKQLDIDKDWAFPDFVMESDPMFDHLNPESETYYIDMAQVVVEAAVKLFEERAKEKSITNKQMATLEEWNKKYE